ncbi:MAG: hypothetical protein KC733_00790 [Candidatus Omnitrophica bacterium]|nr:hypothetical protein [Candidatus Omnitrophota bacterium]
MKTQYTFLTFTIIMVSVLSACGQESKERQYVEVLMEAAPTRETQQSGVRSNFPQMPDDDIHAGVLKSVNRNNLPDDDIHRNLINQENIPNDDIHANLKMDNSFLQQKLEQSIVDAPINWKVPEGWREQKGNNMRLVTFYSENPMAPVETSIISLAGNAGGLSANVIRWMQQISIPVPNEEELNSFLDKQNKMQLENNISVLIIDFSPLQNDQRETTPTIMAAIINNNLSRVFVKMTGSKKDVVHNKSAFESLLKSISFN